MFDRIPKVVEVTFREIICAPARHSHYKAACQIRSL